MSIRGLSSHFKCSFLRGSGWKNFEIFLCKVFLSCVFYKMFIEVPLFLEISPALKNSWLRAWSVEYQKNFLLVLQLFKFEVGFDLELGFYFICVLFSFPTYGVFSLCFTQGFHRLMLCYDIRTLFQNYNDIYYKC